MARHSIKSRLIDYEIHDPPDLDFVRLCVEKDTPLVAFFKVFFIFVKLEFFLNYLTLGRSRFDSADDAALQGFQRETEAGPRAPQLKKHSISIQNKEMPIFVFSHSILCKRNLCQYKEEQRMIDLDLGASGDLPGN